ncbi:MAG: DUF4235 domain-containing protein, partial [Actinomycetes bacterium]
GRAAALVWRFVTGRRPPTRADNPDLRLGETIGWTALSATALAVARTLARRKAAGYWRRSTGNLPPGVATPSDRDAR